jgi:hypothetical protein
MSIPTRCTADRKFLASLSYRVAMARKCLGYVEESFDEIAFAIEGEIAGSLNETVGFWWNDRPDAARLEGEDQSIRVIGFVGEKRVWGEVFHQRFRLAQIRG